MKTTSTASSSPSSSSPARLESHGFAPPDWLGEEITGDERYAGQSLAVNGRPSVWPGRKPAKQREMASGQLKRGLQRSTLDRRAQLTVAGLATAGAAVAGKIAVDRSTDDPGGDRERAYRLRRKEATEDGVRRIAIGQAEKAIEELTDLETGNPAEAVHAARKDLKKLRSLLRLVRDGIGDERYRAQNRRYRDAGRRLSESRDAVVKLETIAGLQGRFGGELPRPPLEAWRADLERERDEVGEGGALLVHVDAAIGEIESGRNEIAHWDFSIDSWELLASGLRRTYRRGRREMKRAAETRGADAVHEWRKRVKDLWYQLRIVHGAWPEVIGATADQAHDLADLLGDHHDLSVLAEDLGGRESVGEQKALLRAIERRQAELLDDALDLGDRLYAEKPKAFLGRLEAYWAAWRPASP